ncbi:hypothetical protein FACS1894204_13260 [Synergistales bacterium]|nr:hypothetical protein FACS1894204_13260 [Synergistales bacterium]
MAKKINFVGPSVQDLGIEDNGLGNANNGNANDGNTKYGITNNGIGNNTKTKNGNGIIGNGSISNIKIGNAKNTNTKIGNTKIGNTKIGNTTDTARCPGDSLYFRSIRDYLYAALGDSDRAEIKLSVMEKELGINSKTLYKHLKTLRETEFVLTKLQYATEIRRRTEES